MEQTQSQEPIDKPLRIGIISQATYAEDIYHFNEELKKINELYGDKITIVVFGYNGQVTKEFNVLEGVDYEYTKPVSIIHYFKQLKALELDLVFVPLINNLYNATSENYNKYLEAGLFSIPLLAPNIFPYNRIIIDRTNGFLYKDKKEFMDYIAEIVEKKESLIMVGQQVKKDMVNFNYSEDNVEVLSYIFTAEPDQKQ